MRAFAGGFDAADCEHRRQPALEAAETSGRFHSLGVPSQPASTLPAASTLSGTVMAAGDSWMCAATSGFTRDLP